MTTCINKIRNRISSLDRHKIFISNDFLDIASNETIRRTLNQLVKEGEIQRVIKGFYYNPSFSQLLEEYEAPSMHELSLAIARKYNWDIAPSENTALNLLGLSIQVPSQWTYISSGRYKDYRLDNQTIKFKKVRPGEINNMSLITATVIQAIKALGENRIEKADIQKLKKNLSNEEKENLLKEATSVAAWIYEVIRQICEDSDE